MKKYEPLNTSNSVLKMVSLLTVYNNTNKTIEGKVNYLKQLFLKDGFLNEYTLFDGSATWTGKEIGTTNTGVVFILFKNYINNEEKRISPEKLLNSVRNGKYEIKPRKFNKRELIF